MKRYVLEFREIEKTQAWLVGGKGLNLGELSKIQGIQVPEGFCVRINCRLKVKSFKSIYDKHVLFLIKS
ncbi:hypothetical protein K0H71_03280 [Bacillus sp. IITD106]|nr:hypothetical protein [Bacillus sp. IITD106]